MNIQEIRMPTGRNRRPSIISDDEFSETTQMIIKKCKKATVEVKTKLQILYSGSAKIILFEFSWYKK